MSNAPLKPTTITDFKRNVDQQKREQTSFGNVLTTITYVVLIGLILVTALAGFGGYQVWQRLNDQAYTIGTLDQKYEAAVLNVTEDLKRKQIELDKIAGQLSRQQEQVSVLRATLDKTIAELRAERANRIRQEATLQAIQKRLSEVDQPLNRR